MEFLIDINVILDYLIDREPYADDAQELLMACDERNIKGYISACEATTLYYLLHKCLHDNEKVYDLLDTLLDKIGVLPVLGMDVMNSLSLRPKDFEDCVIARSCIWGKMDAIVTRNKKDFIDFGIKLYSPKELLEVLNKNKE